MHNNDSGENIEISNSSVEGSQLSQAQRDSVQHQASFQGNNNSYIGSVLNALVIPPIEQIERFFNQSLQSFEQNTRQNNYREEIIELQKARVQNESDYHYWPFQVSRGDIFDLFLREQNKLIIIPSPPSIKLEEPFSTYFQSVHSENEHRLELLTTKYYSARYRNDFQSLNNKVAACHSVFREPIEKAHALSFCRFFSGIPLLILDSQINHSKIYLYITMATPRKENQSSEDGDKKFELSESVRFPLASFNWRETYKNFSIANDDHECVQKIIDIVAKMHEIAMIFMADLYCFSVDLGHNPCLFKYLQEEDIPDCLEGWISPFYQKMLDLKHHAQEVLFRREEQARQEEIAREQNYTLQQDKGFSNSEENYESYGPWIVGVVVLLAFSMFIGIGRQQGNGGRYLDEAQERFFWGELNNAIDHWDIETSRKSILYLRESENPCVSEFAIRLQRRLNYKGEHGFQDIDEIQSQLKNQFGCEF